LLYLLKLNFSFLNNKLHVLFLCGWYPSRILPTNGDFIERHAEAIGKKHNVTVLHIITDNHLTDDIEIISEEKKHIITHIAYLKKTKNPLKKILLFRRAFLNLLAKTAPFDVVHLNEVYPFGIFSLYLKWFKKKPFIISEHFTGYHKPQAKKLTFSHKFISKIITKNAAFVCPVSNNLRDAMLRLGLKGNYVRVPNVVNTNLFFPLENKSATFTITHISNMLNQHKNIEGFLSVVKQLEGKITNLKVKLIGENAIKYKAFAEKINIDNTKIEFIDQIPHKKVVTHLQQSNLFVLFSNYENLPCVILESFSCGVPVIATNVGGISEFFPKEFGYLIAKKDETALLDKILKMHQGFKINKKEMHTYAEENFSEDKIASDFENLYFESIKS
jgi:glycosyltransferase involved in cell wall biosynthesis